MSTLAKFKKLKEEKSAAQKQAELEYRRQSHEHLEERKRLYAMFVELIKPFHKQTVNKHKISLKFKDNKTSVEFSIDGKPYVIFAIETEYRSCNCSECADGGSGHEGSYDHRLNTRAVEKDKTKSGPYFSWYRHADEDAFVAELDRFLEQYDSDLRWKDV